MGSVKLASLDDIPELIRMGSCFHSASGYSSISDFNDNDMTTVFANLINEGCVITDGKSGMLGFIIYPLFFDQSVKMAQELFWWVDEKSRGCGIAIKMLKFAERLAKEKGASVFSMLNVEQLNGKSVENLYQKCGYKKTESSFMRSL